MKRNKGFTLIELLVVIAIIGILSSVVLTSLSGARNKASIAAAQATGSGIIPAATICVDEDSDLGTPSNSSTGGGNVCPAASSTWPALPTSGGWVYAIGDANVTDGTFSFTITSTALSETITCTDTGCSN